MNFRRIIRLMILFICGMVMEKNWWMVLVLLILVVLCSLMGMVCRLVRSMIII